MKIVSNASDIVEPLKAISDLVSEVTLNVTKEGINVVCMDPANVAMIICNFPKETFTEYVIEEDKKIGLNMGNVKEVLKRAGKKSILTFSDSDGKFGIKIDSNRSFSIPQLSDLEKEQKIPVLEYSTTIKLSTNNMLEAVNDADMVAESTYIEVKDGMFIVQSEGDLSDFKVEMPTEIATITGDNQKAKFSIEYLKKIINPKLSDTVEIKLKKDYPLTVDYMNEKYSFSVITAPRVDSE